MNPRINQLVRSLLKKDNLEQCSLPELQEFADRHPYFGAAQLLLTKKMQTGDPDRYKEQLQKTFLFFHNPLWVEHLLNDNGKAEIVSTKKEEPAVLVEVSVGSPVILETTVEEKPVELQIATPLEAVPTGSEPEKPVPVFKIEPVPAVKEELLFEPFHTVDYFASQGIKLREEEKPKDKFGQQLKSFTEWLKTMKRFPTTEIARSEPVAEKKVEEMAEHSLQEKEVVTEAMAEVWEKQGNSVKAIDIYSKLSLLEPAKSAYFAAKIEALKKLN